MPDRDPELQASVHKDIYVEIWNNSSVQLFHGQKSAKHGKYTKAPQSVIEPEEKSYISMAKRTGASVGSEGSVQYTTDTGGVIFYYNCPYSHDNDAHSDVHDFRIVVKLYALSGSQVQDKLKEHENPDYKYYVWNTNTLPPEGHIPLRDSPLAVLFIIDDRTPGI